MLERLTDAIVSSGALLHGGGEVKILKVITEPFTKLVVQVSIDTLIVMATNQFTILYFICSCESMCHE